MINYNRKETRFGIWLGERVAGFAQESVTFGEVVDLILAERRKDDEAWTGQNPEASIEEGTDA